MFGGSTLYAFDYGPTAEGPSYRLVKRFNIVQVVIDIGTAFEINRRVRYSDNRNVFRT